MQAKEKGMHSATVFIHRTRIVLAAIYIFLALLLIAAAVTIPFLFESPSILYKFGMAKIYLRVGKVLGVTAAVLVLFQAVLVSRLKLLDRIFSLTRIYRLHRTNGIIITALALLHPILVIASENFILFPLEKRYWPEFLGIGVFILMLILMTTAIWRLSFGIAYDKWLSFHRLGTGIVIILMLIHILFVSETFQSGLPRNLVFLAGGINLLLIIRLWYKRFYPGKRTCVVSSLKQVARDAYSVEVRPYKGRILNYIPGQFAFFTPMSGNLPREEHPFTLSSTPSQPDILQFVIRSLGDWTSKIHSLRAGDLVCLDGPYGLFSHMAWPQNDPIIMIAGGIGITPMLSMLRYMADTNDQRQILLIWSNKTREHILFPEEFSALKRLLRGLQINHVITRNTIGDDRKNRLDQIMLERLLAGWSRKARVFICGPPGMMKEVSHVLKKIGFLSARVYKEEFKL